MSTARGQANDPNNCKNEATWSCLQGTICHSGLTSGFLGTGIVRAQCRHNVETSRDMGTVNNSRTRPNYTRTNCLVLYDDDDRHGKGHFSAEDGQLNPFQGSDNCGRRTFFS